MEIIATHINADFDCLGAMAAASILYPEAFLVFPGSQEKSLSKYLQKHNLTLPFKKLKDIDLNTVSRLVIVDTSSRSRIGVFASILDKNELDLVVYDHHPESQSDINRKFSGEIRQCGSTSAIMALLLEKKGFLPTAETATAIMAGIAEDTGSFMFPSTTADDHKAAAWLLAAGADLTLVSEFMERSLSSGQLALLNDLLTSLKTITINGNDICIASAFLGKRNVEIAPVVHILRDMRNMSSVFAVVESENRVHVIGRSSVPEVDAGAVLTELGGGGHHFAASATVRGETSLQVIERVEAAIRANVKSELVAADLMSKPVITVSSNCSISRAKELLIRYNVNAMPVVDNGEMKGLITRRIVERAMYHGINDSFVAEYMNTEFMPVSPETKISSIRNYIVRHNRRFVPVFDNDVLVGAVTRTDIMRAENLDDEFEMIELSQSMRGRNIKGLLKKSLPPASFELIEKLGAIADRLDLPVFIIGGFIRDIFLGISNKDIDLTVEGDGIAFAEAAASELGISLRSHHKFHTAALLFTDGSSIDIASTRVEYYESPGALPTVEFSSLKMDLMRRDFTVNTLAASINRKNFGELIDFFGARKDIQERVIRVIHNLSFVEDPTRAYRAVRFEKRLGFTMAPQTESLIKTAVKMNYFAALGGARLLNELKSILGEEKPAGCIARLDELDLLKYLNPDIHINSEVMKTIARGDNVAAWYSLAFPANKAELWKVYLLIILSFISDESLSSTFTHLSFSERESSFMLRQRKVAIKALHSLKIKDLKPSEIFELLNPISDEFLLYMMSMDKGNTASQKLTLFMTKIRSVERSMTGDDIKNAGLPPSSEYSDILKQMHYARLDGLITDKKQGIELLKEIVASRMNLD